MVGVDLAPAPAWVNNLFVTVAVIYDIPCDRGIQAIWYKTNVNSASAQIQIFRNGDWEMVAYGGTAVGGSANAAQSLTWENPDNLSYEKFRVFATSSSPRIRRVNTF